MAGIPSKIVGADTAWLVARFQRPAPLPRALSERAPFRSELDLLRLVAEGVLEIEVGPGFVGGFAGLVAFRRDAPANDRAQSDPTLTDLSLAALRAAAELTSRSPDEVASFLYSYHGQPLSPAWERRVPDGAATLRFLELDGGGGTAASLARAWHARSDDDDVWIRWTPLRRSAAAAPLRHKLYLSPRAEALPEAVAVALDVLGRFGPPPFKIGAGARGLLRPDKFVAYFPSRTTLRAAGAALRDALGALPPHGVPFSAQIDDHGLLSYGVDPPPAELPGGAAQSSWRLWVARRLAAYLSRARADGHEAAEAAWCARARLELDGVNVHDWAPVPSTWEPHDDPLDG